MKFTIDTEKKTIKLEENVCLGTFFQELANYLPHREWDMYEIQGKDTHLFPTTGTHYNPNLINSPFVITC